MTDATWWLGRATVVVSATAITTASLYLFGESDAPGRTAVRRYTTRLDRRLAFLRSPVGGQRVLAGQILAAAGLVAVAVGAWQWAPLLVVPIVALGPKVFIEHKALRRVAQINEQIEPWLNAVANAVKASASLGEAIAASTLLIQSPMREEIDVLAKEYELGTPLDRALENLAERIGSRTLDGSVLALKIARNSGGNLPQMLENAASALRELARLEGVVRTKTAEGKAQALVIGAVPAVLVALIHAISPGFFDPLVTTFLGNMLVAGAALLWITAVVAAIKILAVDV